MLRIWRIWKYTLGSFSDDKTAPYDNYVAGIRTFILVSYMVTNTFIISGVIRHWNKPPVPETVACKVSYQCKNEPMDPFLTEQQVEELVNFDSVEQDLADLIESEDKFNINEYLNSNIDY